MVMGNQMSHMRDKLMVLMDLLGALFWCGFTCKIFLPLDLYLNSG